ncbi:hypothetical protein D3C76_1414440 [compost metagenome]
MRPDLAQGKCLRCIGRFLGFEFQNDRPTAQNRPAQADKNALAGNCQAFDIKAVVLAGNVQEVFQVRVILERLGEFVACVIALQLRSRAPILGRFPDEPESAVLLDNR